MAAGGTLPRPRRRCSLPYSWTRSPCLLERFTDDMEAIAELPDAALALARADPVRTV